MPATAAHVETAEEASLGRQTDDASDVESCSPLLVKKLGGK
jgi:hypothetical protein